MENFTGTLTQEGTVDGFAVKIAKNVVTITADAYRPGKHVFTFKGGDKSYQLTVNLEKLPDITESYAVYDLDTKKPLFEANHHVNNSTDKSTSITLAHKSEAAITSFMKFDITDYSSMNVNFSVFCNGLAPSFPGPWYNGLKGITIKAPDANSTILSFVATIEGKQIYVIMDTKK